MPSNPTWTLLDQLIAEDYTYSILSTNEDEPLMVQTSYRATSYQVPEGKTLLYCLRKLKKARIKNPDAYIYKWLNTHLQKYIRQHTAGREIALTKLTSITGYPWVRTYNDAMRRTNFHPRHLCKSFLVGGGISWVLSNIWKRYKNDKTIRWDSACKNWVHFTDMESYFTVDKNKKTRTKYITKSALRLIPPSVVIENCAYCGNRWNEKDLVRRIFPLHSAQEQDYCPSCVKMFTQEMTARTRNLTNSPHIFATSNDKHTFKRIFSSYHSHRGKWVFLERRFNKLDQDIPLGLELEIQPKDYMNSPQKALWNLHCKFKNLTKKDEPDYYFETDGSLYTNGTEMVTNPMTLYRHKEFWKWWLPELQHKFVGWNVQKVIPSATNQYGIHITFHRKYWEGVQLARLVRFFHHNQNQYFIHAIAQRSKIYNASYPMSYETHKLKDILPLEYGKLGCSHSKYSPIHVKSGGELVEIRVFRSTLNPRSFMKNIEFVDAFHKWCYATPFDLHHMHFIEWLIKNYNGSPRYANLLGFIKDKSYNWTDQPLGIETHNLDKVLPVTFLEAQ